MITSCKGITHSRDFIEKWKELLKIVYRYRFDGDFAVVPSVLGSEHYSYLPFQDFTDKESNEVPKMIEHLNNKNYQVRSLDFDYKDFRKNDSVDMRLEISGMKSEDILTKKIHQNCRRKIKQSIKRNNFETKIGKSANLITDFYAIFSKVMHKHGTPVNTKLLFACLPRIFGDDVFFQVYYLDSKPAGASIVLFDDKLAQLYWNVIDYDFADTQIGYFSFWKSIESAAQKRELDVFDFGRSSFEGTTYNFKLQWGAKPIKVDIIKNKDEDIYSKYKIASRIWKSAPRCATDFIGPRLCKYLVDM